MKYYTPLFLAALTASMVSAGYTVTDSCTTCYNAKYSNKFCLTSWASTSGYCCDKAVTTDYCSSERYFCSDNAPNTAVKLSYCPFIPSKCYGKAIETLDTNIEKIGATTLAFTTNDVCSWRIRSTSEYYFNKQVKVEI